jgi:hypothetical protein
MKSKKNEDILKEIRRVRKKHYEETKHMSIAERMEYDRRIHEQFEKEFAAVKPDYDRFPFLKPNKAILGENTN